MSILLKRVYYVIFKYNKKIVFRNIKQIIVNELITYRFFFHWERLYFKMCYLPTLQSSLTGLNSRYLILSERIFMNKKLSVH